MRRSTRSPVVGPQKTDQESSAEPDERLRDRDAVIEELRASLNEAIDRVRVTESRCFESVPLAYLLVDNKWCVGEANAAADTLFNKDRHEIVGAELFSLFGHSEPPGGIYRKWLAVFKGSNPATFEHFAPGLGKWLQVEMIPSGDFISLWVHDLTKQKKEIEVQIRLYRQQKSIADNSPDIMLRFSRNLSCIFANAATERILGISPTWLIGKTYQAISLSAEVGAHFDEALKNVFATGRPASGEFEVVSDRAGKRWLAWRGVPEIGVHDGGVESVLVIAQDVTARKEGEERQRVLEARLQEAQKLEAVGTLSGGIAHDFNNILAVILGNAELAIDDTSESSEVAVNLQNVRTAALRGRDLVRQILAFSRKSAHHAKPLNITPLVKETVKLLRSTIPTSVAITVEEHTDHDAVRVDPVQIQQIVLNLTTNAAQAMPEGGVLTIGLNRVEFHSADEMPDPDLKPGAYLAFSVRDTGKGIDESTREHIFDPFFSTKGPKGGSGLGLSVVYGIAKAHGGAVTVTSKQGKGSTFTVFLPSLTGTEGETALHAPRELRGKGSILFVDDEELLTKAAHDALSRLGYKVRTEMEPQRALQTFAEGDGFDLVITDQTMPGMSGLNFTRELLQRHPEVPVILCTGYAAGIDEKTAKAAGVRDFLMKPYTRSELSQVVARVLKETARTA